MCQFRLPHPAQLLVQLRAQLQVASGFRVVRRVGRVAIQPYRRRSSAQVPYWSVSLVVVVMRVNAQMLRLWYDHLRLAWFATYDIVGVSFYWLRDLVHTTSSALSD